MGLIDGILLSANLALEWARFAEKVSGEKGGDLILRLEDHFSSAEIGLIASHFGANALRAFSRTLHMKTAEEPTDPDVEISIEFGPTGR